MEYDYLAFIGRFAPFHAGHYNVVLDALKQSANVILVIGSHDAARSLRNPFTTAERIGLIRACFSEEELKRIHFAPQHDHTYNDERWIAGVQSGINAITNRVWKAGPTKIGIIGYDKDHSTFYLKKFPQWPVVNVQPHAIDGKIIHATELRTALFEGNESTEFLVQNYQRYFVNPNQMSMVLELRDKKLASIVQEAAFIRDYKKQWKDTPYPPTFVTVDAVVTQSGHVLLVRRKEHPGKGLYALPGGFLGQQETLQEACIRELYEETRIDVPKPVLVGSIDQYHAYDSPNRSSRGRTITHAWHIRLADRETLPKIKGSDDAEKAFWKPLQWVVQNRSQFFEDHYSIIEHMLGI